MIYEGAHSRFTPLYYVTLELRDKGHGINDYTEVSFVVADTLACCGLLEGRMFIHRHNVSFPSLRDTQSLVLTAK
jgi:hypothetical protein